MCPIVPIFTCGLLRSNFSFAISLLSPENYLPRNFALGLAHNLFRNASWHFFILAEVHGERAASLCSGTKLGRVTEHFGERNHRLNNLRAAHDFSALET